MRLVALLAFVTCACGPTPAAVRAYGPATGAGISRAVVRSERSMVAAANPYATRAGLDILRAGGSAVDAAIAVQMVLTLVEPQSSGIGGGAFMLSFDASSGAVQAWDGRETAPAAATPGMFLGPDGAPVIRDEAVVSGRSVGVPGVLRMLELAHKAHGKLPWRALFQPAISLCEAGFVISPRLHRYVAADRYLSTYPEAREYFYDARGRPRRAGKALVNRPLAGVLRRIAEGGADAFYLGDVAEAIAAATRATTHSPGLLTAADLAAYTPVERTALCAPYREHTVCGMPPPTSGGVTLLELLGILAHFDLPALDPGSARAVHLVAEASRLAYADRRVYVADPDFVDVPVNELLAPDYLARRAALIDPSSGMGKAAPGVLAPPESRAEDDSLELESTSHVAIVDADGNAISMTTSLAAVFGSRVMVRGFLLNNHLTDFSLSPEKDGVPVGNRVEPGKRPRSAMAPTLVLDGARKKLVMAVGSPGGARIIGYVAKTLIGVLDWKLDVQQAINLPNFVNKNGRTELERARSRRSELRELRRSLRSLGHRIRVRGLESGIQGIVVTPGGYEGGADPRREGLVLGD